MASLFTDHRDPASWSYPMLREPIQFTSSSLETGNAGESDEGAESNAWTAVVRVMIACKCPTVTLFRPENSRQAALWM